MKLHVFILKVKLFGRNTSGVDKFVPIRLSGEKMDFKMFGLSNHKK